jgi:hypothetical protein
LRYAIYNEGVQHWPIQYCIYSFIDGHEPDDGKRSSLRGVKAGGIYIEGHPDFQTANQKLKEYQCKYTT